MYRNKVSLGILILLLSFLPFIQSIHAQDSIPDNSSTNDSVESEDQSEDSFQSSLDSLFGNTVVLADTFGWNTRMINSGRFDSKDMTDTVIIPLKDSLGHCLFMSPFQNYITCDFGYRRYLFHYGIDIKLFKGDTVRAAMDGLVRVTKYDRHGYGNVVVIRHKGGLETIYGHLSKVLVDTDSYVKEGQVIGLGGNTGRSTGSHLHFEMRYMGEPFNPWSFYNFRDQELKSDTLMLTRSNFEYLIDIRKAKYCTIRSGDTLGGLAMRYHTSVRKLCQLNHISSRTLLRIGRKLRYQ